MVKLHQAFGDMVSQLQVIHPFPRVHYPVARHRFQGLAIYSSASVPDEWEPCASRSRLARVLRVFVYPAALRQVVCRGDL